MDFSLILVILTTVSGVIWGVEVLYRRVRQSEELGSPSGNLVVEYSRSFFPVLLLVLVVRSFLFEPFRIPSSSMVPTLLVGDFIFVNKFIYGLRLPVLHSKFADIGQPERGDVFRKKLFRIKTNDRLLGSKIDVCGLNALELFDTLFNIQCAVCACHTGNRQCDCLFSHGITAFQN